MSVNKIEPANIEMKSREPLQKRRFSVPETISESFEWVVNGGRGAKSYDIPILLIVQAIFAIILISGPSIIISAFVKDVKVDILECSQSDMSIGFDYLDLIRVSSVIGLGWLIGVIVMALLHFISKLTKMSRRRDQSLHSSAQKTLETIKFLGPYLSLACGAIAMVILVKSYYPYSIDLVEVLDQFGEKDKTASAPPAPATAPSAPASAPPAPATPSEPEKDKGEIDRALELLVTILKIFFTFGNGADLKALYFKNIFPIIINTVAIFILVLTIEKFILQMIASNYRTATTAGRFTENAFALSALKSLYRTNINSVEVKKLAKTFDPVLTGSLFEALVSENEETISSKNLENVMNNEQAAKLFHILDSAQNGDLTKEEFVIAVKAVYNEQETLSKLVTDHDDIISKLDEIMLFVVYSIDFALCLTFLGIPGVDMLKSVFGLLVAVALVFSDALNKTFDALIFVLITHPYDLGDRVEIDGKYLYVESVGLWTTIFDGPGGLKTIMTNASLAASKIANFRRSPAENELFTYLVRPETVTAEAVESLRVECMQFFKENNRDFLSNWHLETSDQIDNERFKIIVKIYHRHNFQNEAAKNERSQKFALFFKDALIRNGFVFSPALPKALATVL